MDLCGIQIDSFLTHVLNKLQNNKSRTEVVSNLKSSSNAVVLANHPTVIEYLTVANNNLPFQVMVYDWSDNEWLMSGPDVPHPLEGHDRLLVRLPTLSDDECMELHAYLTGDKQTEATSTAPPRSRKRSHSEMLRDGKGKGTIRTIKPELPGPTSTELPMKHSPVDVDIDPSPPPPQKKPRRLNPISRSWVMQQTYGTVSCGLDRVHRLRHRGYELLDAIDAAFKAVSLSRSTWQRHDALYRKAPEELKYRWADEHADRLWAEFWQECSGLPGIEADESGDQSSDEDMEVEIKQELLPQLKRETSVIPPAIRKPSASIIELSDSSSDASPSPSHHKNIKMESIEIIEISD